MALKGVIQGPGGTGGGQLSGSGVTSVALSGPAPFITGPPVTTAGTLTFDFSGTPIPVADGGTGMGSFAPSSLITAGIGSSSPFQSKPFPGLSSTFLDGTGAFSVPAGGGGGGGTGTVTSVDLALSSEFRVSGNPVTGAGTLTAGFIQALNVGHGGTGMGSFGPSVVMGGLNSTAPLQGRPLTNLTSNFLRGDGTFAVPPFIPIPLTGLTSTFFDGTGAFSTPPSGGGGTGTVTSVDLALSSEFTVSGNPITAAGTLLVGWRGPLSVAHGGTGLGSTGPGLILGGLTSTGPLQGLPFSSLTSQFLAGDGVFRIPVNPGGTVQSVALTMTSEFSITGSPILGSGTIDLGFKQPIAVAHGGTGMGSFGPGVVMGGLSSAGPLQGLPLTNLTSTFLAGDGVFRIPINPGGTVQSVGVSMTSEFAVQRSPVLGSGTIDIGFRQPLAIAHGGTGLGSFGPSVLLGGLTSTGPLQGLPLTNLTSTFLAGDGIFRTPPSGGGGGAGTVTSVALQLSSEFNVTGSPITNAGTLMGSWVFQQPNVVFAGPTSVAANTPAFRLLINNDLPQSMSGKTMTSSVFQNPTISSQLLAFGSTVAWNMNSGTIALLGMDSTVFGLMATPANLPAAGSAILRIMQLGTGLTSLNWSRYWKFEGGVKPTLSSGFGNIDVISLYMESGAGFAVTRKNFL